jgi:hypothetical protein
MFRALPCSSSEGLRRNCIYAASGIVTLCRWLSCAQVKKESRFFFFVYRHSDLEVSCPNETKTRHGESRCLRAVAGYEIWHWVGRFETFTERNCWTYDACAGEVWTVGGFTLALFQGWTVGSEVLLKQVQLNFSFQNKFIILPCGRPVDNNTFSKMCVFKSRTGYTGYGGYENRNAYFF